MTRAGIAPLEPGMRRDGIRSLYDLHLRCEHDAASGCLIWRGSMRGGMPAVHVPGHGCCSMTKALTLICGVSPPAPRLQFAPRCLNAACANPAHRQWMTRAEFSRLKMPKRPALQRARIAKTMRERAGVYSPELAELIRSSTEPIREVSERTGVGRSLVARIRSGRSWRETAHGASVFSLQG